MRAERRTARQPVARVLARDTPNAVMAPSRPGTAAHRRQISRSVAFAPFWNPTGPQRRRDLHDERRSEHYPEADAPADGRLRRAPPPYHYQGVGLRCPRPGSMTMNALKCSVTEQEGIRAAIPGQREVGDPCRVFDGDQRLLCPRQACGVARDPEFEHLRQELWNSEPREAIGDPSSRGHLSRRA
jgi:hypothetical protein